MSAIAGPHYASSSSPNQPPAPDFKKDGTVSKMRSHAGNVPSLPKTKQCGFCSARFTRTTHLTRHLRNHTNERIHQCDICGAQFTRSDLLSRHKKGCSSQTIASARRKSCISCSTSKVKCDRELPCSKCLSRQKECVYPPVTQKASRYTAQTFDSQSSAASHSSVVPVTPAESSDQHSMSSRDHTSATESFSQIPVGSHLASLYNHDMFELFFSDVFSTEDKLLHPSPSASAIHLSDEIQTDRGLAPSNHPVPSDTSAPYGSFFLRDVTPSVPPLQSVVSNRQASVNQEDAERRHYLHLFYNAFIDQVPVVHAPTFSPEGKPPLLLAAMQACGAIFVKTPEASNFISKTLDNSRQILSEKLSKNVISDDDQRYITLTVVLLHTMGMFHEDAEQRITSGLYHGMLITMIRRVNLISLTAQWSANDYSHLSVDERWRQWALHEMSKRALILSYLQDTSQCIYLTTPSSYQIAEIAFNLPCDNKLWHAQSASDWWGELHRESPYGNAQERLICPTLPELLHLVFEPRAITRIIPISYFAHWTVIHGIIGRLFTVCTNSRLSPHIRANGDNMDQELYSIQFALHNWLQLWMRRPEVDIPEDSEPPFMQNPLPFYWLGQVALMAFQENLPPFSDQPFVSTVSKMEIRFWQLKKWLNLIREFLTQHGNAPTIVWGELMNIRLQSWQVDLERPANDDVHGLLGWFKRDE